MLLCRGIGHGLVKKLLERSNKVIATARVPQEAQQLQQLAAENSNLIVAALDVSQPDSITQFAAEVKKHTAHVDVSARAAAGLAWPLAQPLRQAGHWAVQPCEWAENDSNLAAMLLAETMPCER